MLRLLFALLILSVFSSSITETSAFKFDTPRPIRRDVSIRMNLFGKKEPDIDAVTIFEIPVQRIKIGGLRFSLGLQLVGMQDDGLWKPNESSSSQLDVFFKDGSAKFSIKLKDDAIRVEREGTPSLAYVLQESLILHKVLDELKTLATDGEIEQQNRLLELASEGAIEDARKKLPARQA